MRRTYGRRGRGGTVPATAAAVVVAALLSGCKVHATGTGSATDGKPPGRSASPAPPPAGKPAAPPPARLVLTPGEKGPKVRELQARLRQIGWLSTYPTGTYDRATLRAVDGFGEAARHSVGEAAAVMSEEGGGGTGGTCPTPADAL